MSAAALIRSFSAMLEEDHGPSRALRGFHRDNRHTKCHLGLVKKVLDAAGCNQMFTIGVRDIRNIANIINKHGTLLHTFTIH